MPVGMGYKKGAMKKAAKKGKKKYSKAMRLMHGKKQLNTPSKLLYTQRMSQTTYAEVEYNAYAAQTGVTNISLSEQKLQYYNSQTGLNTASWVEAEISFLKQETGLNTQNRNELWAKYITDKGVVDTGNLHEMLYDFFLNTGFQASVGSGSLLLQNGDLILLQDGTSQLLLQADP